MTNFDVAILELPMLFFFSSLDFERDGGQHALNFITTTLP